MTIAARRLSPALLIAAFALAGCASNGQFPSLAIRPAELDSSIEPPEHAPVEVAPDAALGRDVSLLIGEAEAGGRDFEAAYAPAEAAVARAGASGSDSWVDAQVALSRLEAARGRAAGALGELEQIAARRSNQATNEADYAALQSAIDRLSRQAEEHLDRLNRLKARLGD